MEIQAVTVTATVVTTVLSTVFVDTRMSAADVSLLIDWGGWMLIAVSTILAALTMLGAIFVYFGYRNYKDWRADITSDVEDLVSIKFEQLASSASKFSINKPPQ